MIKFTRGDALFLIKTNITNYNVIIWDVHSDKNILLFTLFDHYHTGSLAIITK